MNQKFKNELTGSAEEIKKLIENIKNNLHVPESADKFVEFVDKNKLNEKEDFKPILTSFCDALREKGYIGVSDAFAEKWHIK